MRARVYRFVFNRYMAAPYESRRGNFWWWLSCKIERRYETTKPEKAFLNHVTVSSSLTDTPESLYITDRLSNFGYGFHGDIELYDDPGLLMQREIRTRVEDSILYGKPQS